MNRRRSSARTARSTSAASAPAATGARTASSRYGLQKLTPNGKQRLRHLATRAIVEAASSSTYTQPCRRRPRSRASRTRTSSTSGATCRPPPYGGPKVDEETLTVKDATLSADEQEGHGPRRRPQAGPRRARALAAAVRLRHGRVAVEHRGVVHAERHPRRRPPPVANLALNAPATADSSCTTAESAGEAVNGTVSGGNSDKWCSNSANKWLQVDLGTSKRGPDRGPARRRRAGRSRGQHLRLHAADEHQTAPRGRPARRSPATPRTSPRTTCRAVTARYTVAVRHHWTRPRARLRAGGVSAVGSDVRPDHRHRRQVPRHRQRGHGRRHEDPAVDVQRQRGAALVPGRQHVAGESASASTSTTPAPPTAPRCSCGPATAAARRCGSRRPTDRSSTHSPARSSTPSAAPPRTAPRSTSGKPPGSPASSGWSRRLTCDGARVGPTGGRRSKLGQTITHDGKVQGRACR